MQFMFLYKYSWQDSYYTSLALIILHTYYFDSTSSSLPKFLIFRFLRESLDINILSSCTKPCRLCISDTGTNFQVFTSCPICVVRNGCSWDNFFNKETEDGTGRDWHLIYKGCMSKYTQLKVIENPTQSFLYNKVNWLAPIKESVERYASSIVYTKFCRYLFVSLFTSLLYLLTFFSVWICSW